MSKESLSFLETKAKRKQGARGQNAQKLIKKALDDLKAADPLFDYDRLYDTRSTGGRFIIPEQPADYVFVYNGRAGALEVKETKEAHRLPKTSFSQYPALQRRAMAGAVTVLAIYHTEEQVWRIIDPATMAPIERGSWDLREYPITELREALYETIKKCK